MNEFRKKARAAGIKTKERMQKAFIILTEEVQRSVLYGSTMTGARGQPVDTGNLIRSWKAEFIDEKRWKLATTGKAIDKTTGQVVEVGYARHVEDNPRGVVFKNGGPHSVMNTRLGMDRLMDYAIDLTKNGA